MGMEELLDVICPLRLNNNEMSMIIEPFDINEREGWYLSVAKATPETILSIHLSRKKNFLGGHNTNE